MHHLVVKQLLSCGELSLVHRPITTWPRILGHCAEEKKALSHFGDSTRDRVKERKEKNPFPEHASKTKEQQSANMPPMASEPVRENEVAVRQ